MGKDPGQSSLIEVKWPATSTIQIVLLLKYIDNVTHLFFQGFTAGGFIYIAVAGVLPEMNDGKTTFKSTAIQLASLILGMGVALCISLIE